MQSGLLTLRTQRMAWWWSYGSMQSGLLTLRAQRMAWWCQAGCTWLHINNSHWDTWTTMFWDARTSSYVANMRSHDVYNPCADRFYPSCFESKHPGCDAAACVHSTRDVSRIQTNGTDWRSLGQVAGGSTPMLRSRDGGAQLYELVGFPYYGVYLGLLDVYHAAGARQEVHCELAWSADFKNWHRIEEGVT